MKAAKSVWLAVTILLANLVHAHDIKTAYLCLTETANGTTSIVWKHPAQAPALHITAGWFNHAASKKFTEGLFEVETWDLKEPHAALNGQTITVDGFGSNEMNIFVTIVFTDGSSITQLLTSGNASLSIQQKNQGNIPVKQYLQLGVEHIWTGIDHLLFVFGLLLLVKGRRRLFVTITAFTLAHSITLALATLNMVHVPPAPVEAMIALSIMLLAVELIRHYQGIDRLTYHYPWIVAFVFGLLHGFGFAGALAEVGLPQQSIPMALVLFNVGVEVGQVFFVAAILLLGWLLQKQLKQLPKWVQQIPPYIIGSLAAFWFIERVIAIF